MAELFRRSNEWLTTTRRVLYRSDTHDALCRTACITCILSSVSQDDARNGMLDRKAALRVLDATGERRSTPLRAEPVPTPSDAGQQNMLTDLRRRREASVSR